MSNHRVPYTKVLEVKNHPGADRLSLARVYDFWVVCGKDQYKVGDSVVYIPVDSILPLWLEERVFPPGSKITLKGSRVRQIRIRKFPSQGLLIQSNSLLNTPFTDAYEPKLEQDLSEVLGVVKFEPEMAGWAGNPQGTKLKKTRPIENKNFYQYNSVENLKWYPGVFEGKEVVAQCKLHGSNCRAGIQPTATNTFWKKVKKFFRLLPKYERVYGSNKVQLQDKAGYTGYYGSDIYGEVLRKVDAFNKIKPGETIYGELIGPGVQKNYDYGHKEQHFVLFDVRVTDEAGYQKYLNPEESEAYAKERGFDFVPVLYTGLYDKELVELLVSGPSVYCPQQKVREGIVVKDRYNYDDTFNGKKAFKFINPVYLDDQTNSDNH